MAVSLLQAAHRPAEDSSQDKARKRQELLSRRRAAGKDVAPVRADDSPHTDGAAQPAADRAKDGKDGVLLAADQPTVFLLPANYGNEATTTTQPDGSDGAGAAQTDGPNADTHVMIAITRVFSGALQQGQKIWILGAKYDPAVPEEHATEATIEKLYILMGRDFVAVAEAPAGAIVGILGLAPNVLKTATLSTSLDCPPFAGIDLVYGNFDIIIILAHFLRGSRLSCRPTRTE